ncbi:MAG: hypothetical protein COA65_03685 [Rhodospirillaceae bacterium]|nr:MAG: hypothetical protein COA65_03685 [Rhodospirillaceae bacterium]
MSRKNFIKSELSGVFASATPAHFSQTTWKDQYRLHRARAVKTIEKIAHKAGLIDTGDFTAYLLNTYGTDHLNHLSDGDLKRTTNYLNRCAAILHAAS